MKMDQRSVLIEAVKKADNGDIDGFYDEIQKFTDEFNVMMTKVLLTTNANDYPLLLSGLKMTVYALEHIVGEEGVEIANSFTERSGVMTIPIKPEEE